MSQDRDLDDVPSLSDASTEAALERVRFVADLMDDAFEIPGTDVSVGLDPLLGIAPVSGDAVSGAISLYIVGEAARAGVPKGKLARMLFNVGVDVSVGSIPVLGTIFDAFWKANQWNASMMEDYLEGASVDDHYATEKDADPDAVSIDIDEESDDE
ncbi:DUF4112 domain-containing protein [Halobium palmae]|uniref:DUF4112 domain-containing protein n=1 Tax=Halobium palmae TaxID=1776492 RepID=A0ABD5S4A2_9EURY